MPARAVSDSRSRAAEALPGPAPCRYHLARLRCERNDGPRWHGRPEWELLFGWPEHDVTWPCAGVAAIDFDGLQPPQLQRVDVCSGADLLYSVDTCLCVGGHVATAGELVQAMASYDGGRGLRIAAADLGSSRLPQSLRICIRVRVDADEALARIRVAVQLC